MLPSNVILGCCKHLPVPDHGRDQVLGKQYKMPARSVKASMHTRLWAGVGKRCMQQLWVPAVFRPRTTAWECTHLSQQVSQLFCTVQDILCY